MAEAAEERGLRHDAGATEVQGPQAEQALEVRLSAKVLIRDEGMMMMIGIDVLRTTIKVAVVALLLMAMPFVDAMCVRDNETGERLDWSSL